MYSTNSGKFTPNNPQKYVGNPRNIIYRSSWECKVMSWFDTNPNVISWASEELVIWYKSPKDGLPHRYFPDFLVKVRDSRGTVKVIVVEVKPYKQTLPPKIPKRKTRNYLLEELTYSINQAKWAAAREFCENRGWSFQVMTEENLGLKINS